VESQIPGYNPRHVAGLQVALADLYESAGQHDRARELYAEVLTSAHPDYAADAGIALGHLLEAEGRPGAEESYERAMLFRTDAAFVGALRLAQLCLDRDDFDAARRPLRFAATSDDPRIAQLGTALLAQLLMADGNTWGARILLERVVAGPDPRTAELGSSLLAEFDLPPGR
jgi:tetratricopeptide (TPR) repeat protein